MFRYSLSRTTFPFPSEPSQNAGPESNKQSAAQISESIFFIIFEIPLYLSSITTRFSKSHVEPKNEKKRGGHFSLPQHLLLFHSQWILRLKLSLRQLHFHRNPSFEPDRDLPIVRQLHRYSSPLGCRQHSAAGGELDTQVC